MHVVSVCPLRVASLLWQPFPGGWSMTVVCKATYHLAPGEAALAESQEYVQEEENHWNDDSEHSLYAPSDLVPFKPSPEVMLVGHAFASGGEPVARLLVHLRVGEVDKSIEIRGDQSFLRDGTLREGPRFVRMPLRWERAAGGPGTQNPVGMALDAPNSLGMLQLPNLRPPGLSVVRVGDFIEPVGFGPIAAAWPTRRQRLGRLAGHWTEAALAHEPMPEGLDPYYFMSGPRDQALAMLRPDERIVLENLCAGHARLATTLPGIEPRAFVELPHQAPTELGLVCDTLWIDTDRSICTLTWRGQVRLQRPTQEGRVVVAMAKSDRPLSWAEVEPLTREQHGERDHLHGTQQIAGRQAAAVLPFGDPNGWATPDTYDDIGPPAALRERAGDVTAPLGNRPRDATAGPAWLRHAQPVPAAVPAPAPVAPVVVPLVATPPPVPVSVPLPPMVPVSVPVPVQVPAPVPPARASSPWAGPAGPSLAGFGAAPMAFVAPSAPSAGAADASWLHSTPVSPAPEARDKLVPTRAASSADLREGAVRGVAAASNAAALAATAAVVEGAADAAGSPPVHAPAAGQAQAQAGAREHVDLLWFDPAVVPKIRASAAPARDAAPQAGSLSWLKEDAGARGGEPQEAKDRRDVLRVLTRTTPIAEEALAQALSAAFREDGSFDPPVNVVTGELALVFDELEALKATITVTTPFIGTDKKLRELVASATEVIKTEGPMPGDIAEGFTQRIEEAFAQGPRAVAPGYLQSSVRRVLLEGRSYQKKSVFGERRIRGLLTLAGGRAAIPAYLPEALGPRLPLFSRFRVSAIVELRPQEDQHEAHGEALLVLALGRLLQAGARGATGGAGR